MAIATYVGQKGSGAPSHTAVEGTLYWDTTNDKLYVNSDGSTTWAQVGGSSSQPAYATAGVLRSGRVAPMRSRSFGFDLFNGRSFSLNKAIFDVSNIGVVSNCLFGLNGSGAGGVADASEHGASSVLGTAVKWSTGVGAGGGVETTAIRMRMNRDTRFYIASLVKIPVITNLRLWFGVFPGNPGGSATLAGNGIALRFDTGAGDTNFRCQCASSGGTVTNTDSGVAVAANTLYLFEILVNASQNLEYYINDSLVATNTSNLPSATAVPANVGWYFNDLGAAAKSLTFSWAYFECD